MKNKALAIVLIVAAFGCDFCVPASAQNSIGGAKKQTPLAAPVKPTTLGGPAKPISPPVKPVVSAVKPTAPAVPVKPAPAAVAPSAASKCLTPPCGAKAPH